MLEKTSDVTAGYTIHPADADADAMSPLRADRFNYTIHPASADATAFDVCAVSPPVIPDRYRWGLSQG